MNSVVEVKDREVSFRNFSTSVELGNFTASKLLNLLIESSCLLGDKEKDTLLSIPISREKKTVYVKVASALDLGISPQTASFSDLHQQIRSKGCTALPMEVGLVFMSEHKPNVGDVWIALSYPLCGSNGLLAIRRTADSAYVSVTNFPFEVACWEDLNFLVGVE